MSYKETFGKINEAVVQAKTTGKHIEKIKLGRKEIKGLTGEKHGVIAGLIVDHSMIFVEKVDKKSHLEIIFENSH